MPTLYLAGPMTGYEKANFPAFDEAASRLRQMGWHVISPADINRLAGHHEFRDKINDESYRCLMIGTDISYVDKAEAIALLPNWIKSDGVFAELSFARLKNIPVMDAMTGKTMDWNLVWRKACHHQWLKAAESKRQDKSIVI